MCARGAACAITGPPIAGLEMSRADEDTAGTPAGSPEPPRSPAPQPGGWWVRCTTRRQEHAAAATPGGVTDGAVDTLSVNRSGRGVSKGPVRGEGQLSDSYPRQDHQWHSYQEEAFLYVIALEVMAFHGTNVSPGMKLGKLKFFLTSSRPSQWAALWGRAESGWTPPPRGRSRPSCQSPGEGFG